MMDIILASTSPARRRLMEGLGIDWRAVAPGVDEAVAPGTGAREAVALLARKKAEAVRRQFPEALVIGADQMVEIDGRSLTKPPTRDAARAQLSLLLGRTHDVVTGLCIVSRWYTGECVDVARPTFRALTEEKLEAYLDLEEWRGCAGGYRIEGAGQALVERLEGDRASVEGLPTQALVRLLWEADAPFFSRAAR
jgi:septum formation protein